VRSRAATGGHFGDEDLFMLISDATESWVAPDLGPRPDGLRLRDATELDHGPCGDDVRALRFGFDEAGRQLYVDVAVGEGLYRERPEMLRYILDSIEISEAN
jgi:hypothetical protein